MKRISAPRGHEYNFTWDALGRLFQNFDPAGGYKQLTRAEDFGQYAVSLRTAMGRTAPYEVVSASNGDDERQRTHPDGTESTLVRHADASRTSMAADGTVRLTTGVPDPRFGMRSPVESVTTAMGSLLSEMTSTRTTSLATPGNPFSIDTQTEVVSVNGREYSTVYDGSTRTLTQTTPEGRETVTTLDEEGRVVSLSPPGRAATEFTYDTQGRLHVITQAPGDPDARTWTLAYDSDGNLASVEDPLSQVTSFEYDPAARVTKQVLPDLREILFGYDASGNTTSITPPGRPAHGFTYTGVDLEQVYLPPELDPNPSSPNTFYLYNPDRQLTLVTRPDDEPTTEENVVYEYDATGGKLTTETLSGA